MIKYLLYPQDLSPSHFFHLMRNYIAISISFCEHCGEDNEGPHVKDTNEGYKHQEGDSKEEDPKLREDN